MRQTAKISSIHSSSKHFIFLEYLHTETTVGCWVCISDAVLSQLGISTVLSVLSPMPREDDFVCSENFSSRKSLRNLNSSSAKCCASGLCMKRRRIIYLVHYTKQYTCLHATNGNFHSY